MKYAKILLKIQLLPVTNNCRTILIQIQIISYSLLMESKCIHSFPFFNCYAFFFFNEQQIIIPTSFNNSIYSCKYLCIYSCIYLCIYSCIYLCICINIYVFAFNFRRGVVFPVIVQTPYQINNKTTFVDKNLFVITY